uniref:Ig-like domain-containing protein n=1 Tax=Chelonoidis abingdonii TaxID=106734 RepID=A0A8C0H0M3_CHEAB
MMYIYFICFIFFVPLAAQFTVIGPDQPVTAIVGEDTVLPCHLSPRMSAENMEVRWFRSEFTSFVHLYQHGQDQYGQQMPEYHGRTEFLKAGIMDGNVALKIVNVRQSDEGKYRCFVQDGVFYEEAVLELKVEASGSAPQISVEGYQDGGIQMVCQLAGWYPEPEVLWRDRSGQLLSSSTKTKSKDGRGLFEIKSSIIITESSNQNLSCSIRNAYFNLEKEPSTFYISGEIQTCSLVGPDHPVTAIVGEEIVLPCHLSPRMSAEKMEMTWFRSQISPFVHHYSDGKDQYGLQMPEFQGRTELLKDGLLNGSVALRILSIRPSDEGQYHCLVLDGIFYEEALLDLKVAGLGSVPLISVERHQDGGIWVVCQSADWYPEAEVLWRDLSGRHLPSFSETTSQGENSLFETETALIVTELSNQKLSCCIRNTVLNQEKESAVYIAGQSPSKPHTELSTPRKKTKHRKKRTETSVVDIS